MTLTLETAMENLTATMAKVEDDTSKSWAACMALAYRLRSFGVFACDAHDLAYHIRHTLRLAMADDARNLDLFYESDAALLRLATEGFTALGAVEKSPHETYKYMLGYHPDYFTYYHALVKLLITNGWLNAYDSPSFHRRAHTCFSNGISKVEFAKTGINLAQITPGILLYECHNDIALNFDDIMLADEHPKSKYPMHAALRRIFRAQRKAA
ncbi:MAG: hypothetical protein WAX89_03455 [Alphaproteobacteria bacterium]